MVTNKFQFQCTLNEYELQRRMKKCQRHVWPLISWYFKLNSLRLSENDHISYRLSSVIFVCHKSTLDISCVEIIIIINCDICTVHTLAHTYTSTQRLLFAFNQRRKMLYLKRKTFTSWRKGKRLHAPTMAHMRRVRTPIVINCVKRT